MLALIQPGEEKCCPLWLVFYRTRSFPTNYCITFPVANRPLKLQGEHATGNLPVDNHIKSDSFLELLYFAIGKRQPLQTHIWVTGNHPTSMKSTMQTYHYTRFVDFLWCRTSFQVSYVCSERTRFCHRYQFLTIGVCVCVWWSFQMSANHVSVSVIKLTSTSVSLMRQDMCHRQMWISTWSNMSTRLEQTSKWSSNLNLIVVALAPLKSIDLRWSCHGWGETRSHQHFLCIFEAFYLCQPKARGRESTFFYSVISCCTLVKPSIRGGSAIVHCILLPSNGRAMTYLWGCWPNVLQ